MKISKGAWIGFIVAVIWIAGVILSWQHCKWNPVCTTGTDMGISCTICAWLFFMPAVIGLTSVTCVLKNFGPVSLYGMVPLISTFILFIISGMSLGAVIEKLIAKIRTKKS